MEIKARHPGSVLFFRLGDFYETFDDDAELIAEELNLTLTSKPMGKGVRVPLAGIPVQSLDNYLAKLIERGHRVAICEQLEDPKKTKGLVQRDVVRVVSPGTNLSPTTLEQGTNNYCASLVFLTADKTSLKYDFAGIAATELSTGDFRFCELRSTKDSGNLETRSARELARLGITELLLPNFEFIEEKLQLALKSEKLLPNCNIQSVRNFEPTEAMKYIQRHYELDDLTEFDLVNRPAATVAISILLEYLVASQPALFRNVVNSSARQALPHLSWPKKYDVTETMELDSATERALELFPSSATNEKREATLLGKMDRCNTAFGRRLLTEWIRRPELNLAVIEDRLDRVDIFHSAIAVRKRIRDSLSSIPDIERLLGRAVTGLALPTEIARLGQGLSAAETIRQHLDSIENNPKYTSVLKKMKAEISPCPIASKAILSALADQLEGRLESGGIFRSGLDENLDKWRTKLRASQIALVSMENRERKATNISNLKIGYHRTFGYYLEVSKSHINQVPESWQRRQTLAGGERYVTLELQQEENRILEARNAITERESELFKNLCEKISNQAACIRTLARGIAQLDIACGLADLAADHHYVRPKLDNTRTISIREGRHPVVEQTTENGNFVPNDCEIDAELDQLMLITGPNMGGKSTYLRQVALIVLMAQIGSFVPAAEARIGLVDRVFARVGAHDNLVAGQSTFMLEMLESAGILSTASDRSLLVLDEIGRGTSTYDGLAIARALLEHLIKNDKMGPRTLFATHFHELTSLAKEYKRVLNAHVGVTVDEGDKDSESLQFLYRILPGGSDRSYGINVAKMAKLPSSLLDRARELLREMEKESNTRQSASIPIPGPEDSLSTPMNTLLEEVASLNIENLTPLHAISALFDLRDRARKETGMDS